MRKKDMPPDQPLQPPEVHLSRTPSRASLADGQSRFGLDIGGSLLKLIYLQLDGTQDDVVKSLQVLEQVGSSRPGSQRQSFTSDAAAAARLSTQFSDADEDEGPPVALITDGNFSPPSRTRRGVLDPSLSVHVPALGGKLCAWPPLEGAGRPTAYVVARGWLRNGGRPLCSRPLCMAAPATAHRPPRCGVRADFAHFATSSVEHAVEVLRQHRLTDGLSSLQATGGGAHKYRKTFEQRLGVQLLPCNELDAVVLGMCAEPAHTPHPHPDRQPHTPEAAPRAPLHGAHMLSGAPPVVEGA